MKLRCALTVGIFGIFLSGCSASVPSSGPSNASKASAPAASIPVLTPEQKGQNLIETLSRHSVQVQSHFEAPGGLRGYIVEAQGKKRGSIVYTSHEGDYLFSGNIISAKGENVTQQETETYIDSKLIGEMYGALSDLNYFSQGPDSAPHKLYIIFDPNCSICHMVYNLVQPMLASGDLQVRWIPVGIMAQSSVGKAAAILMGNNDADRMALLKQDEDQFDLKTESGGIPELKLDAPTPPSKTNNPPVPPAVPNSAVAHAFELVAKNNQYFSDYGFVGTPVFFLEYQNGDKKFFPGFYQGTWLSEQVNKAGANWS